MWGDGIAGTSRIRLRLRCHTFFPLLINWRPTYMYVGLNRIRQWEIRQNPVTNPCFHHFSNRKSSANWCISPCLVIFPVEKHLQSDVLMEFSLSFWDILGRFSKATLQPGRWEVVPTWRDAGRTWEEGEAAEVSIHAVKILSFVWDIEPCITAYNCI